MQNRIQAEWLENESRENLRFILAEYRFLVSRFVQWVGLTLGKSADEDVRQFVLHNLVEECGQRGGRPSHLSALAACLASCGTVVSDKYLPLPSTHNVEAWFFDVFANQECHTCLSVLGPGTESVSQQFLAPLEAGLRHAFAGEPIDYTYFDVHRPEVEAIHAQDIEKAIALVESSAEASERDRMVRARSQWSTEAVSQHARFWNSLWRNLHG